MLSPRSPAKSCLPPPCCSVMNHEDRVTQTPVSSPSTPGERGGGDSAGGARYPVPGHPVHDDPPAAVAGWVPDSASAPSAPLSTPPRPPGSGTRAPPSWLAAQASISPCHGTGVLATPNVAAGSWRTPRARRSAYLMRMPPRTTLAPVPLAAPETRAILLSGRLRAGWSLIGCSLFCWVRLGPDHVGCWAADRWWPKPRQHPDRGLRPGSLPIPPRAWPAGRGGITMRPAFGQGRVRPGT